jgi:hypothetical protein
MKITEARIRELIVEEKNTLLSEQSKINGVQYALREIALQSSELHDSKDKLSKIDEADLRKIKLLAENLDSIFYRVMNS